MPDAAVTPLPQLKDQCVEGVYLDSRAASDLLKRIVEAYNLVSARWSQTTQAAHLFGMETAVQKAALCLQQQSSDHTKKSATNERIKTSKSASKPKQRAMTKKRDGDVKSTHSAQGSSVRQSNSRIRKKDSQENAIDCSELEKQGFQDSIQLEQKGSHSNQSQLLQGKAKKWVVAKAKPEPKTAMILPTPRIKPKGIKTGGVKPQKDASSVVLQYEDVAPMPTGNRTQKISAKRSDKAR